MMHSRFISERMRVKSMGASRDQFKRFFPITTRWSDNDVYGHVNNVVYYSYFDTVANQYLIEEGGLDIEQSKEIAFVVNSSCDYFSPVAYPSALEGGLSVEHLGNSSVRYRIGIFEAGASEASAAGTFTHVFVTRATQKSCPIPDSIRSALLKLTSES
jgi:acyl-CoA thioester hydrolase